jgi:hypothetical protein
MSNNSLNKLLFWLGLLVNIANLGFILYLVFVQNVLVGLLTLIFVSAFADGGASVNSVLIFGLCTVLVGLASLILLVVLLTLGRGGGRRARWISSGGALLGSLGFGYLMYNWYGAGV